ncbi:MULTISPECIES: HAD family hydrolase [Halorussus]|uniref:HAD family hydrolase n=1 Tax=Halorussus TaxID=1070314 RepID=UPI00209F76E1|nr:HAD family hydrolase [Halorussus vallis]USZ76998.1 HAD family hydrolase [Halorussus vallis]
MSIAAVVFDFDYTLAVPNRPRDDILAEAAESVGAPPITRARYQEVHARYLDADSREPIFAEILEAEGSDADPAALAAAYRDAVGDALVSVPGVEGMLADLKEEYRLGLLTNGSVRAQQSKLDRFDWLDDFEAVVITGNLDAGKPDERAFKAVLDALGVEPEQAVYVGDDPDADVRGAKGAGMYAVQVVFEGGPDPAPEVDAYVERDELAAELPRILDGLAASAESP